MKNTMSILRIIAFAILITFALVGCSSQSSNKEKEEKGSSTQADSQYPIPIKHAFGETVLKANLNELQRFMGKSGCCISSWCRTSRFFGCKLRCSG